MGHEYQRRLSQKQRPRWPQRARVLLGEMLGEKMELGGRKAGRAVRPRCEPNPRGREERELGESILGYCVLRGKPGRALGESFS